MNNQFSENLKKVRKENSLSQEQLADELGVSRQAISKWESAAAYPEMDKIIAICDKFNLNIDDLLHRDIKEVKGEEESKKKINKVTDDFLGFFSNTINMFTNMNFKSKIKCLFEQIIIAVILFLLSLAVYSVISALFRNLLEFLPQKPLYFITNVLDSILVVALMILAIVIIVHIFKTRYLDYYVDAKESAIENANEEESDSEGEAPKEIFAKKKESKIVIRDPKHSEDSFIRSLFKIIVGFIKFFVGCLGLVVIAILIALVVAFAVSFMLYKTGVFFIGLLLAILSSTVITVIILLLILNFIFNRKNDKKKMIWSFIGSLIIFGLGCGLICIGVVSFDVIENDKASLKTVTREYEMKDDLLLFPFRYYDVEYVASDNSNIKIEYTINKYCDVDDSTEGENENSVRAWTNCKNPMKIVRDTIKNANNKKIVLVNIDIEKVTVYTNANNIEVLKANLEEYTKAVEREDEERYACEREIDELQAENSKLEEKNDELQEKIDEYEESR